MKGRSKCIVTILTGFLAALTQGAPITPEQPEPEWWRTPRRLLQTNLREIDARMDLDAYVASLREAGANVVLFNVGGIVANYPTGLPFHYRNPFMTGDLTGEVVRRLHAEGIRVIGRFDFSKVNERIAAEHPEYLARDGAGRPFPTYNGQVPACLNGWYQQEGMLRILGEVLDRYPLDGVFFNMIGYPRSDYSGRSVGICQCQGCKERFRAMYNLDLPKSEKEPTEAGRRYGEFTSSTVSEQFNKVNRFIKQKHPHVAICTYTAAGVDVIRTESNTSLDEWKYEESLRARRALLTHPEKQLANAAVHFPWYAHRLVSVSPDLTRKRIFQGMVNGAWLDFYCIGPFHAQEDRLALGEVTDLFRFHATNEAWLTNTIERADIGLLMTDSPKDELQGLAGILSSAHVSFDLARLEEDLSRFPTLVLPLGGALKPAEAERLDAYVRKGGRLLMTGGPLPSELRCAGIRATKPVIKQAAGTYIRLRPEDKQRLVAPVFGKLDLVFLDGDLWPAETEAEVQGLLRFIPPAMFGPPEKCYYTNVSDVACLHVRKVGAGRVAWFPWQIGAHYQRLGHAGHAALVMSALERLLEAPRRLRGEAPAVVEMNHRADRAGRFEWVSLYNHSGEMDKVQGAPIPVRDVRLHLQPAAPVRSARLLKAHRTLSFTRGADGQLSCVIPELAAYEILLLEFR